LRWSPLWLACAGLVACAKPHALPDAAALLAAERAKEQAVAHAAERERRAADERVHQGQLALGGEFEALARAHAPLVGLLQRWDAAGDGRANPVAETIAAWPRLPTLQPVLEACELRLHALASKPLHPKVPPEWAGRVRQFCDVVRRAVPIVQRQVVAAARPFLTTPRWVREIPERYVQHGRVNWHEWLHLRAAERLWDHLAPPHLAAAQAVGAILPRDEMLRPALEARSQLEREVERGLARLGLPAGLEEPALTRIVAHHWPRARRPASALHGLLLAVRAVDAGWLPLRDATGKVSRELREAAVLLRATEPAWAAGCWVTWVRLERTADVVRLVRTDDVRKVRCPGQGGGAAVGT